MHALIVDDHDLFRQGLAQSLLARTDVVAVLEANAVQSARHVIQAHQHELNLVLLDHGLPDGEGLALLKEIQARYPLLPVAILSAHEDFKLMRESMDAGAVGFIPKSTPMLVLISAIKLLLAGGVYIPPSLYQMGQQADIATHKLALTARQEEVLQLLCCGHSNKEIACCLNIAEATVKAHVTVVLKSRGVSSRSMLLALEKDR